MFADDYIYQLIVPIHKHPEKFKEPDPTFFMKLFVHLHDKVYYLLDNV